MKLKEQTKPIKDKSNNQAKLKAIFNDLINKKKKRNKLNEVKIGKKIEKKKEVINNLNTFYNSREEVIKLFRDLTEMLSDSNDDVRQNKTEGTGLKILTPKQMLQRLPIALAQVKASNNSENLLNEIRQIVYSLYQPKHITKKLYKHIIKSIQ